MDTITVVLVLILLVVASSLLARVVPAPVPLPVVQVCLGVLVSLLTRWHVRLDPEIFFMLFLPPLLFLDGWRIPPEELYRDRATIAGLALGLVVFTIVGAGWLTSVIIPSMPLPVAFALAAVLSPTDPIAVSAIASRVPIPGRMMRILEGESLLNDATGLVGMRFAVAAALTGAFSLRSAAATFAWVALGGMGVGIALTYAIIRAQEWTSARFGDESSSQILTSLLIPFAAYIVAERVHCSGILAAVAAGLTMSVTAASGRTFAGTRVRGQAVWDLMQAAVNGIIFVLLGLQLPGIAREAFAWNRAAGDDGPWSLVLAVVLISAALAALRLVWVQVTLRLTMKERGGQSGDWRLTSAFTLAGVRGAVTLAGVLTLPLTLNDGSPFPARPIAVFIAAGVIVLSLVLASAALPRLLHGIDVLGDASGQDDEDRARVAAAKAALAAIRGAVPMMAPDTGDAELTMRVATRLMDEYQARISAAAAATEPREPGDESARLECELRILALDAERGEIFYLLRTRRLGSATARRLVRKLDLTEARLRA